MRGCLTKREFEYKGDLFETLGIKKEDAVGKDFEQLSQLISEKYEKLSLKFHPDKGGSREGMSKLNNAKNNVISYITPLKVNIKLIPIQEFFNFSKENEQMSEGKKRGDKVQLSKRSKAFMSFYVMLVLFGLLQIASFIYLVVKFFQNTQLDLKNILFGIGLFSYLAILSISSLLQHKSSKIVESLQKEAEEKSETLTVYDSFSGLEREFKANKKYSILNMVISYLQPLSIITMVAGLITESALNDFKTVDTKLLIGVALLVLSFGLQYLANEIYERKVINLVKEERAEGKLDNANVGTVLAIHYQTSDYC